MIYIGPKLDGLIQSSILGIEIKREFSQTLGYYCY